MAGNPSPPKRLIGNPGPLLAGDTQLTLGAKAENFSLFYSGDFSQRQIECMNRAVEEFRKVVRPKHKVVVKVVWAKDPLKTNILAGTDTLPGVPPIPMRICEQKLFYNRALLNTVFDHVRNPKREDCFVAEVCLYRHFMREYNFGPETTSFGRPYDVETLFLHELLHVYLQTDGFRFDTEELDDGTCATKLVHGKDEKEVPKGVIGRWHRMLAFATTDPKRPYAALLSIIDDPSRLYNAIWFGEIVFRSGNCGEGEDPNIARIQADGELIHLDDTTYGDKSEETLFTPVQPRNFVQRKLCDRIKKMLAAMADPTDPGPAIHTNDEDLEPKLVVTSSSSDDEPNEPRKRKRSSSSSSEPEPPDAEGTGDGANDVTSNNAPQQTLVEQLVKTRKQRQVRKRRR